MKKLVSLLMATMAFVSVNTAHATPYTWQASGASAGWSASSSNWSPTGTPGSADTAIFDTGGAATVTFSAATNSITEIQFGSSSASSTTKAFTLGTTAGTPTINVTNGAGTFLNYIGTGNTATETVNEKIVLGSDSSTYTISNSSAGNLVVAGAITAGSSGTQAVTLSSTGSGKITISGAGTYTGGTTIASGMIVATSKTAFGTTNTQALTLSGGTLDIAVASGGVFDGATTGYNTSVTADSTILTDVATSGSAGVSWTLGGLSLGAAKLTVDVGSNVSGGTPRIVFGSSTAASVLTSTTGATSTLYAKGAALVIAGNLTGSATTGNVDTVALDGTFDPGSVASSAAKINGTVADGAGGGKVSVVKNGSGSWILFGNNTYTGGTTINAGTLYANQKGALGLSGATVTLNGGTLDFITPSTTGTNAYNVTLGGTATIASDVGVITGSDGGSPGPGFTYTLGTLSAGGSTLNITAGSSVTGGSPAIAFGAVTLNSTAGATTTLNPTSAALTVTNVTGSATSGNTDVLDLDGTNGASSVTGVISDGGVGKLAVTKTNTGTWTIGAANTFTGAATIGAGTLNVSFVAAAGTAQSLGEGSVVNLGGAGTSSGVLNYTGGTATLSGMTINVLGNGADTITNTGAGTLTIADAIVKNGTTFNVTGKVNIAGVISGSSANSDMDYNGATSTVSVAGTYNGATRIFNGSTVTNGVDDALPDTTGGASANTTVTLGDSSETSNQTNVYALGGFNQTVGGLVSTSGAGHTDTNAVIGGGAAVSTLNVNVASGSDTYNGLLGNGVSGASAANNLAMVKTGAGSLTLTSDNTYTAGTTVTSGTLVLSNGSGTVSTTAANNTNGSATGSGALSVSPGATLAGKGTSQGTSFSISGTSGSKAQVYVGQNSSADVNTMGSLTLLGGTASGNSTIANANLTFNLNVASVGAGNKLDVGATGITFGSGVTLTLNLQNIGIIPANSSYVLIAGTGLTTMTTSTTLAAATSGQYTGLETFVNSRGLNQIVNSVNGQSGNLAIALSGLAASYYGNGSYLYIDNTGGVDDIDVEVVPEPGTWALMIAGLALLVVIQRRRKV